MAIRTSRPFILGAIALVAAWNLIACAPPHDSVEAGATTFDDNFESSNAIMKGPRVLGPVTKRPVPAYVVPKNIRDRIHATDPLAELPEENEKLQVSEPHLEINSKKGLANFTGILNIDGKAEALSLSCPFDVSAEIWSCTDMFPTDLKIAAQKRLQASFKCVDKFTCENSGVQIWIVIDHKLQPPLVFQTREFRVYAASSGDAEDDEAVVTPPTEKDQSQLPATPPKNQDRLPADPPKDGAKLPPTNTVQNGGADVPLAQIDNKGTESQVSNLPGTQVTPGEEPPLSLDDPNTAIEYVDQMQFAAPTVGEYSAPEIAQIPARMGSGVPEQAMGTHNAGYLLQAKEMEASGDGFVSRDHGAKDFGANLMIDLLTADLRSVHHQFPSGSAIVIGSVANRKGGQLITRAGNPHASHQNGLDADVGLPSKTRVTGMWNACNAIKSSRKVPYYGGIKTVNGTMCPVGANISDSLDDERFWLFLKQMTCADNSPVIAMFLDVEIKNHMCAFAKRSGEPLNDPKSCAYRTLQALVHETGHYDHVHVRLKCPGNEGCSPSKVSLPTTTLCPN